MLNTALDSATPLRRFGWGFRCLPYWWHCTLAIRSGWCAGSLADGELFEETRADQYRVGCIEHLATRVVPARTEVDHLAHLVGVATSILVWCAEDGALLIDPDFARGKVLVMLEGVASYVGDNIGAALEVFV